MVNPSTPSAESVPVACTLIAADAAKQVLEWHSLNEHALGTTDVHNGVEVRFPADLEDQVRDLAAREAACCAFLDLQTTVDADVAVLTITSENPEAKPVIELLSGSTSRSPRSCCSG